MDLAQRPSSDEHSEFLAGYIGKVPDGDIRDRLEGSLAELREFYGAIPEAKSDFSYAPGKWTVRDIVAHIADCERVFAYRALRFGRGDATPLPGFDQDVLAPNANVATRSWESLLADLYAVREATLHLFRSFGERDWARRGEASGHGLSVRAIAWVVAGHELHHRAILTERYGI
ncbi:MAG: DinB family protein [Thermoanaerobaculia bacterium]